MSLWTILQLGALVSYMLSLLMYSRYDSFVGYNDLQISSIRGLTFNGFLYIHILIQNSLPSMFAGISGYTSYCECECYQKFLWYKLMWSYSSLHFLLILWIKIIDFLVLKQVVFWNTSYFMYYLFIFFWIDFPAFCLGLLHPYS